METEEKTYRFKTNINCGGCVSKVTTALNEAVGVSQWKVDTSNKDKILEVHSNGIAEPEIIKAVQNAGFTIESIKP